MAFCTAINCMDGRVQLPVINYLMKRFGVDYVDAITEPGPVKILAEERDRGLLDSILNRVCISTQQHGSGTIAICAHADCAGNPVDDKKQKQQLIEAALKLRQRYAPAHVIALWLDANWNIRELEVGHQ